MSTFGLLCNPALTARTAVFDTISLLASALVIYLVNSPIATHQSVSKVKKTPADPAPPVLTRETRKTRNSTGSAPLVSDSEPPTPSGRRTRRSLQAGTYMEIGLNGQPVGAEAKPKQRPKTLISDSEDESDEDANKDDQQDTEEQQRGQKQDEDVDMKAKGEASVSEPLLVD
eukprot:scaffold342405_cov36-Prasinocladus_malaysianus.AAC.1